MRSPLTFSWNGPTSPKGFSADRRRVTCLGGRARDPARPGRLSIVGLVLAAGSGTRFGAAQNKLLAPWRGRSLIEHVLATVVLARQAGLLGDVVVVHLPAVLRIGELAVAADCDAVMVTRERPAISESIKAGFVALEAMHDLRGVTGALLMLGDQPRLSVEAIRAVVGRAGESIGALVRPRYSAALEVPGHPVLLGRALWKLVSQTDGDSGLDRIVADGGLAWDRVEVAGANPDVDTAADLAGLDDEHPFR